MAWSGYVCYNVGEPQGALTPRGSRIASAVWFFLRLPVLADREPLQYHRGKVRRTGYQLKHCLNKTKSVMAVTSLRKPLKREHRWEGVWHRAASALRASILQPRPCRPTVIEPSRNHPDLAQT